MTKAQSVIYKFCSILLLFISEVVVLILRFSFWIIAHQTNATYGALKLLGHTMLYNKGLQSVN